jgi:predicted MPP superfamily phosphohydrolase
LRVADQSQAKELINANGIAASRDHEAQVFGQGINYFHFENLPWSHAVIRVCLIVAGIYGRGRRNAARVDVKTNDIRSKKIPAAFDEYTVLQLSDLHADMSEEAMKCIEAILPGLQYDMCVLTGDYRAHTFGPYEPALESISRVCSKISKPVYGVLGNHDTIRMLPELEQMGIRMLLNECIVIERDSARIHLAGIDDAHFYRADNIEKADWRNTTTLNPMQILAFAPRRRETSQLAVISTTTGVRNTKPARP